MGVCRNRLARLPHKETVLGSSPSTPIEKWNKNTWTHLPS